MSTNYPETPHYPKPPDFKPVERFPEGHRLAGKLRCTAWAVTRGQQCEHFPCVTSRTQKCWRHGGKTPRGVFSANWKTGKYSRGLPERAAQRYEESLNDPELLSLREQMAVVEARAMELIGRSETGEAGAIWKELNKTFNEFEKAQRKKDITAAGDALMQIRSLINRGLADWHIWQEIFGCFELKRRLSETEAKRLVQMQVMISVEQAMTMLQAIAESIKRNVRDKDSLRAISDDYTRIVSQPDQAKLGTGSR